MAVERTLSIIKPDAVAKNVIGKIYSRFETNGLKVIAARMVWLSPQEAGAFYAVHKERSFFSELVGFMTSGPVMVPMLTMLFAAQGAFPPGEVLHIALGTSAAAIVFTSLVQQVVRESGYEEVLSSGIVLTGGSSVMPGMIELGEDIFLKPVRRGIPKYSSALSDMVAQPRASTVMGLLEEARLARLRGFKVAQKSGSMKTAFGRFKDFIVGNF